MPSHKNPLAIRCLSNLALVIALFSLTATAQIFQVTNFVSDISSVGTQPTDSDLVNAWGLAHSPTSPWWAADNGSGLSTIYDGTGAKLGLVVNVPQWDGTPGGNPDGIVFNGTPDFQLNGRPALFLFATEDGTIQGWNGGTATTILVNGWPNAVYKGLALGSANGAHYIYAANFRQGTVDVFDATFQPHSFDANAFIDNSIPAGYAPFNVANIDGKIVVAYAKQDDEKHDDVAGQGHGFLRVFDSHGKRLQKLPHVPELNSPWGIVMAPSSGWGATSGKLLVGQFGSGGIMAFDLASNTFLGPMRDTSGLPIRIDGLWGLGFGNDAGAGPSSTLFFAAGYFAEAHGLFGTITRK
ncbi:MAG: TIGR03118 family protein [Terriglobales bacterium]